MRTLLFTMLCGLTGCALVVDAPENDPKNLTGTGAPDGGADAADAGGTPEAGDGSPGVCFEGSDPPFITPREPTLSIAEACMATGERTDTFASAEDLLALVVGSWLPCGGAPPDSILSHGFVIGGDRTFRFVETKAGVLTESAVVGRVKVIPNGEGRFQLDVEREGGTNMLHITRVGAGDRIDISETGGSGSFARTAPGSAAKSTTYVDSGKCALAGAWDAQAGVGAGTKKSSGTFAFDGRGHFVGGALGSNICGAPTITGTYRLVGGSFEIVTSTGMGCPESYAASWAASFSEDCRRATLTMKSDNCTGGRHSIAYTTELTRR